MSHLYHTCAALNDKLCPTLMPIMAVMSRLDEVETLHDVAQLVRTFVVVLPPPPRPPPPAMEQIGIIHNNCVGFTSICSRSLHWAIAWCVQRQYPAANRVICRAITALDLESKLCIVYTSPARPLMSTAGRSRKQDAQGDGNSDVRIATSSRHHTSFAPNVSALSHACR